MAAPFNTLNAASLVYPNLYIGQPNLTYTVALILVLNGAKKQSKAECKRKNHFEIYNV